jgi:hypothetical protein
MPLYRVTPVNPHDPNWRASVHREAAVIRADSEEQARSLASQAIKDPRPKGRGISEQRKLAVLVELLVA